MNAQETKALTDCLKETAVKYLKTIEEKKSIIREKQVVEQDRDILAEKLLKTRDCYAKLSDIHTRLLVEYAKLQVQLHELTNLNYRVFSNN